MGTPPAAGAGLTLRREERSVTPEEYRQSVAEAWRAAVPMVATVGWVVAAAAGLVGGVFV